MAKINYKAPKRIFEPNNHDFQVDKSYVPLKVQIRAMQLAGERVKEALDEQFDFFESDPDMDFYDPTRDPDFDPADATEIINSFEEAYLEAKVPGSTGKVMPEDDIAPVSDPPEDPPEDPPV